MDETLELEQGDVIVVGAGPAGSTCAALLARGGWRTLLVDAGEFPRHKVCGECLGELSLPVLRALGVEHQVLTAGASINRLDIILPDQRMLALSLAAAGQRMFAVSRHHLDQVLLDRARECGVHVLSSWRVSDVVIDRGRVAGVVVSPTRSSEPPQTLRSPVIVAADGRRSIVVRKTGHTRRRGPALVGVKRHYRMPAALVGDAASVAADAGSVGYAGRLVMHSLAGGYLGLCLVDNHTVNVCGVVPRRWLQRTRGSVKAALATLLAEDSSAARLMAAAEPVTPWLTVPDVLRQTARPDVPGVLYIGDALGTIEPLTGQGMSMALASGQRAAERVLAVGPEAIDAAFQRGFAADWQRTFGKAMRWGAALGWLLRHPDLLSAAVRASRRPAAWQSHIVHSAYRATRLDEALHK